MTTSTLADRPVGHHDGFEPHRALDFRAHRFGGVLRLHLAQHPRQLDAAAGAIRAAARAAAPARSRDLSRPRTDAAPVPVPAPPPCRALRLGHWPTILSSAPGSSCRPRPASWPECSAPARVEARLRLLPVSRVAGASTTGTVILSLPGSSALRGGSGIVAAAATAAARAGLRQPDDVVVLQRINELRPRFSGRRVARNMSSAPRPTCDRSETPEAPPRRCCRSSNSNRTVGTDVGIRTCPTEPDAGNGRVEGWSRYIGHVD